MVENNLNFIKFNFHPYDIELLVKSPTLTLVDVYCVVEGSLHHYAEVSITSLMNNKIDFAQQRSSLAVSFTPQLLR